MSALVLVMAIRALDPLDVGQLRDAEVEHLDEKLSVRAPNAEEVRGLQVAVDDPERVRVGDGLAGLKDEVDGQLDGQGAPLLDPRREVAALEVLHDDVRRAVLQRADVEHASDVLALDLHGGSRLAQRTEPRPRRLPSASGSRNLSATFSSSWMW